MTKPERIWRIRTRYERDHTREAWRRSEVGVWYGGWRPADLVRALETYRKERAAKVAAKAAAKAAARMLDAAPAQSGLNWKLVDNLSFFHAIRRFAALEESRDWVVVVFGDAIHLGRVKGSVQTTFPHPLNMHDGNEPFHWRRVEQAKSFPLAQLPGVYRIVTAAGRGNVHEHNKNYTRLLRFLADSQDPEEVARRLQSQPLEEQLELLGPWGWEALCLGYLILEEGYLPTGLLPGKSMATFDLVGHGHHGPVLAQCKKDRQPVAPDFVAACEAHRLASSVPPQCYWFGYDGVAGEVPDWVRVVDRMALLRWRASSSAAREFLDRFLTGRTEG
jgi:hypothetical protein